MAFDLFNTPDALIGAPVSICDYGAECIARPSAAYTQSTGVTGQDGSVQLLVKPVAGTGGMALPPWFLQIQPSTHVLPHRLEAPSGWLRPFVEAPRLPVFPEPFEFPPGASQETRYLAGLAFDCRGSRLMAAARLKIFLEVPGFTNEAFYRLAYWSAAGKATFGLENATYLSGVFSIMIGTGPRPKNDYPDQLYKISAIDAETGALRISSSLRIPTEGHMLLVLYPPSVER